MSRWSLCLFAFLFALVTISPSRSLEPPRHNPPPQPFGPARQPGVPHGVVRAVRIQAIRLADDEGWRPGPNTILICRSLRNQNDRITSSAVST